MLTLSKNRVTVPVLLQQTFLKIRQENLQLFRMADDSFLVAFERDAGHFPELLLGCIGQWVNTDDYEFAKDIFVAIEVQQGLKFLNPVSGVSDCNRWKEILTRAVREHM